MSFAVDANILVYASDRSSAVHATAAAFLTQCAEGPEIFCLAWVTICAYLRIATHPAVFRQPLTPDEAAHNIGALLARPNVRPLGEEDGFWDVYRRVTAGIRPRGNGVPDAHLAAILYQHGVRTLYTRDRDFLRYDFLDVVNPLDSKAHDAPRRKSRSRVRARHAPG